MAHVHFDMHIVQFFIAVKINTCNEAIIAQLWQQKDPLMSVKCDLVMLFFFLLCQ